jgi:hypothetical protein
VLVRVSLHLQKQLIVHLPKASILSRRQFAPMHFAVFDPVKFLYGKQAMYWWHSGSRDSKSSSLSIHWQLIEEKKQQKNRKKRSYSHLINF